MFVLLSTLPGFIFLDQNNEFLFRSDKIFAVLTVMLIIWGTVLFYLFRLERKVSDLECRLNDTPPDGK